VNDEHYVTLRNLLGLAVLLLVATVGSNIYVGLKLEGNSRVFDKIYGLLETGMGEKFASAMAQATAMEKELSQVREHAQAAAQNMQALDGQFRKAAADAENSLVVRLNRELPALMDRYIEARAAKLREPAAREEIRKLLREELQQMVREELKGVTKK
jgi:hypothetical protein